MGILSTNLNNVNLDDTSYKGDNSYFISLIRPLAWHVKFEKHKPFKKKISEKLMPKGYHPKSLRDDGIFACQKTRKKKQIQFLLRSCESVCF